MRSTPDAGRYTPGIADGGRLASLGEGHGAEPGRRPQHEYVRGVPGRCCYDGSRYGRARCAVAGHHRVNADERPCAGAEGREYYTRRDAGIQAAILHCTNAIHQRQRQPSNTASINVSASQPISAANDAASTASLEVASSAAATSVSQKSPESGQSTSTRERRHSAEHASSQTQPQPATNVTAGALLAATANVPPASVQQAVTADSGSLSDTGDNDAPGGGASSLTDETAVTKMALTSHGATSKSDSTEDSTPIKVDVVSQATYFAPVASLSPAQQIASAVAPLVTSSDAAAQDSSTTSSARAATPVTDIGAMLAAAQPSLSAVKTLDLQIEPPDLGTVNVKISLSDGGLQVEVQASQSTTRDLLEKDKQELNRSAGDTGYTVASVDISLAASSGATNSFADQGAAGQNSSGQTSEGG